ncbi:MAG: ArsC family reductase [Chitinophagaceae bacterium]|nr:ArsC family reductase [Chitinophagaceae bacterium]MCW5925873.1 ArsC family reductase [Chitinophagaceae bacterium]
MITVYGIKTCDTTRKAMVWLKKRGLDFQFHDFREDGVDRKKLEQWSAKLGWEVILNKKSTTWRGLSPGEQAAVTDAKTAVAAMLEHPTLIKRPVIEDKQHLLAGFDEKKMLGL